MKYTNIKMPMHTKSSNFCTNCGHELTFGDLFCEMCGMRIHASQLSSSKPQPSKPEPERQEGNKSQQTTFRNFSEWVQFWAELYVKNYEFWQYLIYSYDEDSEISLPLITCAHQFQSLEDMREAYIYLCRYGSDRGFGMPADSVLMCDEELRWYVLLTCSDLPFVLLIAEFFNASICGWADHFMSFPPMPISIDKSISITSYKGNFAPVKMKRQMPPLKKFVQKHLDSKTFKSVSGTKANLRSTYYFFNEIDYKNTKHIIYNANRAIHDKLIWHGEWRYYDTYGWSYTNNDALADFDRSLSIWRIDINDNLTQEELEMVVGHIREHRGLYYQY